MKPLAKFGAALTVLSSAVVHAEEPQSVDTKSLINQLGHVQFSVREDAYVLLSKQALNEASVLKEVMEGLKHEDPEVRDRCRKIAEKYYNPRPDQSASVPPLGMLPDDYPEKSAVLHTYYQRARELLGEDECERGHEAYHIATLLFIDAQFQEGKSRKEIIQLLNEMFSKEELFRICRTAL